MDLPADLRQLVQPQRREGREDFDFDLNLRKRRKRQPSVSKHEVQDKRLRYIRGFRLEIIRRRNEAESIDGIPPGLPRIYRCKLVRSIRYRAGKRRGYQWRQLSWRFPCCEKANAPV